MSTTIKGDEDLISILQKAKAAQASSKVEHNTAPNPNDALAAAKPKNIELQDGEEWFSDVFWEPKFVGRDFPVRVYNEGDWPDEVAQRIPHEDPTYTFPTKETEEFALSVYQRGPILLHGPTGTGKTSLPRQFCAKVGIPFLRVSCHRQMESSEFLGTNQVVNEAGTPVTKHSDTDTTLAAKFGGMLVVDEAFRSPILMAIQSLLEYPNSSLQLQDAQGISRSLPAPDTFQIVLTDNTNGLGDDSGSYHGEVQDLSTLDRIAHSIYVDYMQENEEMALLKYAFPGIDENIIHNIRKVADLNRKAFQTGTVNITMSIRGLFNWLRDFEMTGDIKRAYELSYMAKLSKREAPHALETFQQVFGSK